MERILSITTVFLMLSFIAFGTNLSNTKTTIDTLSHDSIPKIDTRFGTVYSGSEKISAEKTIKILSPYPEIAIKYEQGENLNDIGTGLIIGGAASMVGGIYLMVDGLKNAVYNYNYSTNSGVYNKNYQFGNLATIVGNLMINGGIACKIIGKINVAKSIRNYNNIINSKSSNEQNKISYQVGLLNNGNIGIKLTF